MFLRDKNVSIETLLGQTRRTIRISSFISRPKGWKTGTPHRIEIWYVKHQGRYFLVSQYRENAHWVRNIKSDSKVSFEVLNSKFSGLGRLVDSGLETDLVTQVCQLMDSKYKWSDGLIVELRPEPGSD